MNHINLFTNISEGIWQGWSTWSCSVTCGTGTEMRMRNCSVGNNCQGTNLQRRRCDRISCDSKLNICLL